MIDCCRLSVTSPKDKGWQVQFLGFGLLISRMIALPSRLPLPTELAIALSRIIRLNRPISFPYIIKIGDALKGKLATDGKINVKLWVSQCLRIRVMQLNALSNIPK